MPVLLAFQRILIACAPRSRSNWSWVEQLQPPTDLSGNLPPLEHAAALNKKDKWFEPP